jgi:anti-anti-sigma factor
MNRSGIFYADRDGYYVLKFVGDIRYTMGCSLDELLEQHLSDEKIDSVFIDLSEASSIDSTSLGLMAKVANLMLSRSPHKVTLVSPNEDINQILESIGFDDIFDICHYDKDCPLASEQLRIDDPAKENMAKTMLEAHSILSELNDKNRSMFKEVIGALKARTVSS